MRQCGSPCVVRHIVRTARADLVSPAAKTRHSRQFCQFPVLLPLIIRICCSTHTHLANLPVLVFSLEPNLIQIEISVLNVPHFTPSRPCWLVLLKHVVCWGLGLKGGEVALEHQGGWGGQRRQLHPIHLHQVLPRSHSALSPERMAPVASCCCGTCVLVSRAPGRAGFTSVGSLNMGFIGLTCGMTQLLVSVPRNHVLT